MFIKCFITYNTQFDVLHNIYSYVSKDDTNKHDKIARKQLYYHRMIT